jgi:hypothetical protein
VLKTSLKSDGLPSYGGDDSASNKALHAQSELVSKANFNCLINSLLMRFAVNFSRANPIGWNRLEKRWQTFLPVAD